MQDDPQHHGPDAQNNNHSHDVDEGKSKYLYFIQATESKRVKIGISSNPDNRLSNMQTGSPEQLELISKTKFPVDAIDTVEEFYHTICDPYHHHGEWYKQQVLSFQRGRLAAQILSEGGDEVVENYDLLNPHFVLGLLIETSSTNFMNDVFDSYFTVSVSGGGADE